MNSIMLGLGVFGSGILTVIAFAGGLVFSYLFLRANPNKKAQVDKFTAEQAKRL